jgi:hypothetical protein
VKWTIPECVPAEIYVTQGSRAVYHSSPGLHFQLNERKNKFIDNKELQNFCPIFLKGSSINSHSASRKAVTNVFKFT